MREFFNRKRHNVRDVAKLAGVSVATVSRVLNNADIVSKDKRARVESAIEALQFVPSSSARAINSGRTRLVGALVPTLDHAIFARYISAIEAELDTQSLSLIVATTGYDDDQELDKTQRLLNIGVEGLLVSGIARADNFTKLLSRYQIPVIATSYYDAQHALPTIGYDNAKAAQSAWDHLAGLGHKNIAILTSPVNESDRTRARLKGLEAVSTEPLRVFEAHFDYASAATATCEILEKLPDVTAFLCLSDVLAQGALLQLGKMGVKVPQDLSIIGIDDLPSSASFDPPLTSVHLPVGQMGQAAARALALWIETGQTPSPIEINSRICVRGSTRPNGRIIRE